MSLYSTIESLCVARGVTVTQMCRDCGVARASLSDLKSGRKHSLSAQTLAAIANHFDVSVDYLIGNEKILADDDEDIKQYLQMLRERPETRMLLDYSKGVDKEDIEAVAEMIRRLRKND